MLIYDCEIEKGIAKKGEARLPGIEYCQGWRDFEGMGLTVIGAYDYDADRYRVFCKDNLREFQTLVDAHDVVVGFNNRKFDDQLVAAHGLEIVPAKSYDILRQVWLALGLNADSFSPKHGGYGLDACCGANFGTRKTGHGALAPVMWQRGQYGAVIDYCLNDVAMTKQLLDLIVSEGRITNPKEPAKYMLIQQPLDVVSHHAA